jgi:serine/threonine protein kinase
MSRSLPPRIGQYSVIRQLGAGATSDVYLAQDVSFSIVAIKRFSKSSSSSWHKQMFLTEMELGQQMRHKNIVRVLGADLDERSGAYLVMEYVPGVSLDRHEHETDLLPINAVLAIIEQIAGALRYAAELGIVHRDVKPANIILMADGTAKLTDFGCAVPSNRLGSVVAGSLAYMSPKQIEGEALDQRADIYALGAVLYRLLTGKYTFEAESNFDARIAILNFPIIPLERFRQGLPPALVSVINRALKKNAAERYATWDEFLHDFGDAAHSIRMSDHDLDLYRGLSLPTQSALSQYSSPSREFSRSGFSRSTMPEY